ncbi:uncharacterized protein EDB93DRAFT_906497 [Suillus bovinus]|uniref:uncharacterized protein n=1 Tax=Suillus bovinus TaxID=48563 RepID=UPI001B874622|nr:uncharacterized protein EDB93DRAFT_906497 [Suillus bovinus]KAG2132439.1 hypothetical protein EDB93DRAFT_906497 [Suillus bovinus]
MSRISLTAGVHPFLSLPTLCEGDPVVCRYHVSASAQQGSQSDKRKPKHHALFSDLSGARNTVLRARPSASARCRLCWSYSAGRTSTTVIFAWGAQLRSSFCVYTSGQL